MPAANAIVDALMGELATIGPRPAGSPAAARARELLIKTAQQLGLTVALHQFIYQGWELVAPPTLALDDREDTPCAALLGSVGGSFEGVLEYTGNSVLWGMYHWETYAVAQGGRYRAMILVRSDGPAIAQPVPRGGADIPHLCVGAEWAHALRRHVAAKGTVRGCLDTRRPVVTGGNVRAWRGRDPLEGSRGAVLAMAHYDTVPGSPGVFDNAGGVSALMGMADLLAGGPAEERVELVFTDAEELSLAGSRALSTDLHTDGRIGNVRCCLNLDGAGRSGTIGAWLGPEALIETVKGALGDDLGPVVFPPPEPGDHFAFWERGVPAVMLTRTDPEILHLPTDGSDERKTKTAVELARLGARLSAVLSGSSCAP
jgi:hypothetical protein